MKKLGKLIFIFGVFCCSLAQAALELELKQGIDSAIPIAITTFAGQESIASPDMQTATIVSNDLKNSGRFRLITAATPSSTTTVDYDAWRSQGADNVVVGEVTKLGGDQYKVVFRLFDIYNRTQLLTKDFTVKTSQLRQLAHHISDMIYQQLTGDRGVFSTKIAYILVQRSPGAHAKYKFEVADADGYNPRTLLTSIFPVMSPAWSPDGKKIAYVSFEGNRAGIYVQDLATGQRKVLSKFPGINGAPAWSPDGSRMALVLTQTGYPKIYVWNLVTNGLQRITSDWYLDTEPAWSPDGRSIIFTSNRGGTPQIYQVKLDDKSVKRITYDGKYNARASFTPDGKNIVMLHQDDAAFNIALQDLSSGRVAVLTNSGNDESPSIAPNGKMVVYATNTDSHGTLAEVSIDGRVKILLPAFEGEVQEPAWGPF